MINEYIFKKEDNYKMMFESYNRVSDLISDCESRSITSSSFYDMRTKKIEMDWYYVNSYQEALDLLSTGYQPTVDKLKTKLKITAQGQSKRTSFSNSVVGFAPIVPLALQGVPNSMLGSTMKPMKAKVIDVYYDMTASARIKPEDFVEAGEKMLATIMELEMQGYRFNLYALQSYSSASDADILKVKIKDSRQPMDLKRMSFPLTHPAFFRVIGFDWYSKTPKGEYRSGYGRYITRHIDSEKMDDAIKDVFGGSPVYFSCLQIMENNMEYIKKRVLKKEDLND